MYARFDCTPFSDFLSFYLFASLLPVSVLGPRSFIRWFRGDSLYLVLSTLPSSSRLHERVQLDGSNWTADNRAVLRINTPSPSPSPVRCDETLRFSTRRRVTPFFGNLANGPLLNLQNDFQIFEGQRVCPCSRRDCSPDFSSSWKSVRRDDLQIVRRWHNCITHDPIRYKISR